MDGIQTTTGGNTTFAYPLYDGHGNMKALVDRAGQTTAWRQWDAWGALRSSDSTPAPRQGYCASLGHVASEGGLLYMRARYYEPGSGRFLSEDPARDGANWFVYCGNEPVSSVDPSGCVVELLVGALLDEFLDIADGSAAAAAKSFAKDKILDACSYWAGRLVGELIAQEAEELFAQVTSRGFGIGNEKGSIFIDFDGTNHGGKVHVDTYGSIKHYVQSTCRSSNYRLDLFLKGLQEALIP